MQTILGAGGAIGTELAKALTHYTTDIRLVGRNPKKINPTDTLYTADITDRTALALAIQGSSVCYVTVGFEYSVKTWQAVWLPLMRNVISVCEEQNCKLVFFDNVYAIGGDYVQHITEQSPISPSSRKGAIRADVDRLIMNHVEKGTLTAIIARAPDFFGAIKEKSLTMNLIYDNLKKGNTAQWLCNADMPHSTGYTPDLAKGTAILGNTESAYNQIWNLPVDHTAPTGREWVDLFAEVLHQSTKKGKVQTLPAWMIKTIGWFVPIMGEMHEMLYQYDRPYIFDSSKFNTAFNYTPTSNQAAVQAVVDALQ